MTKKLSPAFKEIEKRVFELEKNHSFTCQQTRLILLLGAAKGKPVRYENLICMMLLLLKRPTCIGNCKRVKKSGR